MNTRFSTLLRVNNPADFRFRWGSHRGGAMKHHPFGYVVMFTCLPYPAEVATFPFNFNVMSSTPLGNLAKHIA